MSAIQVTSAGVAMNNKEAIQLLREYNAWRRDVSDAQPLKMPSPTEIGIAIEQVISMSAMHDEAMKVLKQIASMKRKTREQRLANACVIFLGSLEVNK